ncbi:MAG: helix-turn-helix transcriptional regulator [Clostridia bacterium]|nr:helix-turn-helix transcriptional regulator [Clostridia bacterium]
MREYDEINCSPEFSVVQNLEGECEVSFNSGEFKRISERSVVLIPAYTLVRVRHTPSTVSGRCKELRLTMDVVIDGCKMEDLYAFPQFFSEDECEKVFVLLNTIKDNENVFRAYSNLYRLLELMLKYAKLKTEKYFLKDIYEYIISNCDKQMKVAELAEAIGVSEPTVYRMFAQVAGCTPIDYINAYRLGKAHAMLGSEAEMKIKEIASSCGFDDQLYFSKMYSKAYGISPRGYRRALNPKEENATPNSAERESEDDFDGEGDLN